MVVLYLVSLLLDAAEAHTFIVSGMLGIVAFIAVEAIGTILKCAKKRRRRRDGPPDLADLTSTCWMPRSASTA
jgi:hypothetical protein